MENKGAARAAPPQDKPQPRLCTVVAVDTTNFFYRACAICERTLTSSSTASCFVCSQRTSAPASTLLFRLLLSIATAEEVMIVVCFDRAARTLFGCSANDFAEIYRGNPETGERVGEMLRGEMCRMTLSRGKKGNAEHLRVASVVPLRSGFRPVIERLREVRGGGRP